MILESQENKISKDIELEYNYFDFPLFLPLNDLIGRKYDLKNFKEVYLNNNFICIRGIIGIGKTEFLKYFLSSELNKNTRIGWFRYKNNLKDTFLNTKQIIQNSQTAYGNLDLKYKEILEYFSMLNENYVLIFDDVTDINNDDMKFLLNLKCKVIVISNNCFEKYKNNIKFYNIGIIPTELTNQIFEYYYSNIIEREETGILKEVLKLSGYHTLMIELLAKICNNCKFKIKKLYENLKDCNFNLERIQNSDEAEYEFNNAEKFFIENLLKLYNILNVKEKNQKENFFELENTYNKIAFIYSKLKKYNLALKYYKEVLKIVKENDDSTNIEKIYNNIALAYYRLGMYNEALEYYKKILKIQEKTYEKENIQISETYYNIACCYTNSGQHNKASEYCEKSLNIKEKETIQNYFDIVKTYNTLALIYYNLEMYGLGLEYCEKSLKIINENLNQDAVQTSEIYYRMAVNYEGLCIYDLALEYHKKALNIREKELGKESLITAVSYGNLALLYKNLSKFNKAFEYNEKALNIKEKELGKENLITLVSYNNAATIYECLYMYDMALEYHKKALTITKIFNSKNFLFIALSYNNIASVYNKFCDYETALEYYKIALNIAEKNLEEDNPFFSLIHYNIDYTVDLINKNKNMFKYFFDKTSNFIKAILENIFNK